MQRELPVPGSLLEAGRALDNSPIKRPQSSNVSIGDIYVRYVDVIAAMKASWPLGHEDMQWLSDEVEVLDTTLQAWRQGIHPQYNYTTVHATTMTADDILDLPSTDATKGRRHVYQNEWSADLWNKWRVICMLLYRLKLDYGILDTRKRSETLIREISMDICLSVPSLMASSRKSMYWCCPIFQGVIITFADTLYDQVSRHLYGRYTSSLRRSSSML